MTEDFAVDRSNELVPWAELGEFFLKWIVRLKMLENEVYSPILFM